MARSLHAGMSGADVKALQQSLNYHMSPRQSPLAVDGAFGPKTQARVEEFQRTNHLTVDGVVGPVTGRTLIDVREVEAQLVIQPPAAAPPPAPPQGSHPSLLPPMPHFELRVPSLLQSPTPGGASPPAPPSSTPSISYWGLSPQLGPQFNVPSLVKTPDIKRDPSLGKPYFSPVVANFGLYYLMKKDPFDVMVQGGGQFGVNAYAPANVGGYTASLYGQVGFNSMHPFGRFDLFNPFLMVQGQKNQAGTWQDAQVSGILGNAFNLTLFTRRNRYTGTDDPVFSATLNAQVGTGADLHGNWVGVPFAAWFGFTGTPWF